MLKLTPFCALLLQAVVPTNTDDLLCTAAQLGKQGAQKPEMNLSEISSVLMPDLRQLGFIWKSVQSCIVCNTTRQHPRHCRCCSATHLLLEEVSKICQMSHFLEMHVSLL